LRWEEHLQTSSHRFRLLPVYQVDLKRRTDGAKSRERLITTVDPA
jgi:hypothetical protein